MASRNDVPFAASACGLCVRVVKWVPVVFIFAVVVWSYYAYVWELCIVTISSVVVKILYICIYHIFLAMFLWSWARTIFTSPGRVPCKFKLTPDDMEKLIRATTSHAQRQVLDSIAQSLPVHNRTIVGAPRYCEKCYLIKPDRSHHCGVCGVCVLKMDHHCPWVNNCVSFTNYKFFVLFLAYAFLYSIFITITSLQFFILFWRGELDAESNVKFQVLFLFFVSAMFATSLVSLFSYHIYLVCYNRSTLEAFRAPVFRNGADKHAYNLGKSKNFRQVFGDEKLCWFFPIYSSAGDGVVYPMRSELANCYESIERSHHRPKKRHKQQKVHKKEIS